MVKSKGFTLIELVMVIVILGILSAVALPKFVDLSGKAEQAAVDGVAGSVASASTINYAAYKAGATFVNTAVADPCTSTLLGGVMQGGWPSGYNIALDSGDCNSPSESATCEFTKGAATATAAVICTR